MDRFRHGCEALHRCVRLMPLAGFVGLAACSGALHLTESDHAVVLATHVLDGPSPADSGSFAVEAFYYGSGNDRNRPEYRDSVSLVTRSVDASKLVDLERFRGEERARYWGFTPDSLPLNARVWAPVGQGPFPLVLIVHGNHDMKDFSDPGYAYLGRLLASRGFILASVDMNFLNGFIDQENDARGWLLLKHLEAWRSFNQDTSSSMFGRVDLGNIALIGHSRGGEAVANAAAFNRLSRYPDDATLEFDFGFDIRAVVSIAPVDGQYLPTGRKVVMEDVSYLVIHGSHDADVRSFHGLRLFDRLRLGSDRSRFKAAIYVYRANHGQFNEGWGAQDSGSRSGRILDLRALLPAEDQRQIARVYITAFLEATLGGDHRYLPMFVDHRVAGGWLPPTMYVTRFQHSAFRPVADFEEDIDVTTGSTAGIRILGERLLTWKEGELQLRSSNRPTTSRSQENQAAWLAWRRDPGARAPALTIELSERTVAEWGLGPGWTLDLSLAPTRRVPRAPDDPESVEPAEERPRPGADRPVDLSIEVEDASGTRASVRLGRYGPIRRPLEMFVSRRTDLERERDPQGWELILQTYSVPLADFRLAAPELSLGRLVSVRLVFDQVDAGEVVVDDIGFTDLDPAFLAARVPMGGPAAPF